MQTDVRSSGIYQQAQALYRVLRLPGEDRISDATEVDASRDGRYAVFTGTLVGPLEGTPPTRICLTDLSTGETRVLTAGPNSDRCPKVSPRADLIAFVSDREAVGDFQLYLLSPTEGRLRAAHSVAGWIEYLQWSPDGSRILLGVAGHGADIAGGQGAVRSRRVDLSEQPSWMPYVDVGNAAFRWRSVWIYDVDTDRCWQLSQAQTNVWEAAWCGDAAVAAVVSDGPEEGLWYSARLTLIDLRSRDHRDIYTPLAQLGWPAGSASGRHLAVVEGIASDRWIVAGCVQVIDTATGACEVLETQRVDVSYCEWQSETELLIAGHRDWDSVIGVLDTASHRFTEVWSSSEIASPGRYMSVVGMRHEGNCVLLGEGFFKAPELAVIERGAYRVVKSFDLCESSRDEARASVERLAWKAPDGLEIQGWLLRPPGQQAPVPLVMEVHGGPVWHWHPHWLGRNSLHTSLLLEHGYAIFLPNPRGSTARGQTFAREVVGDINGADAKDLLSGLAYLVSAKLADPKRIGVMGRSYGGNMTAWLITQDSGFGAAITVAPHTNQISARFMSNIPQFADMFLAPLRSEDAGKYLERSPIMFAHRARTPTLNFCGALDRCTPPEEAVQFHQALLENGVESVLVVYPEEGHGIRQLPALFDFATRVVGWFQQYMPAGAGAFSTEVIRRQKTEE